MSSQAWLRPLAALAALLAIGTTTRARAQESPTVALRYHASPACPTEARLVREVDALLGRRAFDPSGAYVLDVDVATDPTHASIALIAPDGATLGTRRVELDGSCRALLGPLALVVALLAELPSEHTDVRLTLPPEPSENEPSENEPSAPPEPDLAPPDDAPPAPAPARPMGTVSLLGGVELGLGPEPAALTGLGLGIAPIDGVSLHLDLVALPYASTRTPDAGVDRTTLVTFLDGCADHAEGRTSIALCAEIGVGAAIGSGTGLDVGRTAVVPWLVLGLALRMRVALDDTWFVAGVLRAGGNAVRPAFDYDDAGVRVLALRASEVDASGGLEVGALWGR